MYDITVSYSTRWLPSTTIWRTIAALASLLKYAGAAMGAIVTAVSAKSAAHNRRIRIKMVIVPNTYTVLRPTVARVSFNFFHLVCKPFLPGKVSQTLTTQKVGENTA